VPRALSQFYYSDTVQYASHTGNEAVPFLSLYNSILYNDQSSHCNTIAWTVCNRSFAQQIDLSGMHVDVALRKFQAYFRMPVRDNNCMHFSLSVCNVRVHVCRVTGAVQSSYLILGGGYRYESRRRVVMKTVITAVAVCQMLISCVVLLRRTRRLNKPKLLVN